MLHEFRSRAVTRLGIKVYNEQVDFELNNRNMQLLILSSWLRKQCYNEHANSKSNYSRMFKEDRSFKEKLP